MINKQRLFRFPCPKYDFPAGDAPNYVPIVKGRIIARGLTVRRDSLSQNCGIIMSLAVESCGGARAVSTSAKLALLAPNDRAIFSQFFFSIARAIMKQGIKVCFTACGGI